MARKGTQFKDQEKGTIGLLSGTFWLGSMHSTQRPFYNVITQADPIGGGLPEVVYMLPFQVGDRIYKMYHKVFSVTVKHAS